MPLGVHDHPFYRPLWVRLLIVAATAGWAAFEAFVVRDGFWTVLAVAVAAYCVVAFLIRFPRNPPPQP